MAFELKIDDEVILSVTDTEEKIVKNSVTCFKEWIKKGILNLIKNRIGSSVQIKIDDEIILNPSNAVSQDTLLQHKDWIKTHILNIIKEKINNCRQRLELEWTQEGCDEDDYFAIIPSKLAKNGVVTIPDDQDEKAELIFSQSNYKNRVEQDAATKEAVLNAGVKI